MHTNYLIGETSPYLLQHAHNPVNWYPWGDEALDRAQREKRPILLSIGYSACHWCHVMEHESFENEEIAALMNEHFVNIKVDREERPDLDEIYMNAVQMLTGRGGWPMTLFLTPEGKPFFGGTYFPPEDRYGVQGFPSILTAVAQVYREKPDQVATTVDKLVDGLNRLGAVTESDSILSSNTVRGAAEQLADAYDHENGGLGRAPKFPNVGVLALFLRVYWRTGEGRYLDMITHTLKRMADGGIYDHLGGGFHRYSVDEKWMVPHFEKMIYDNAQLTRIYADLYRVTGEPRFKQVVEDNIEYLLREMVHPEGGFYSTQDADSEGDEGKYYVWDRAEVMSLLGEETGDIFGRFYDVSDVGNFEGKNILHPILTLDQAARYFKKEPAEIDAVINRSKAMLLEKRETRGKPFRDEKILASWNGLMLSAMGAALKISDQPALRKTAERTVEFLFTKMVQGDLILHTYKDGKGKIPGFLDDYCFVSAGLLDLYEVTLETSFYEKARWLADRMIADFWDDQHGGFFTTGTAHDRLISRSKPAFDGSVPSGNAVACQVLLKLYHYTGEEHYLHRGERILRLYYDAMEQHPFGLTEMIAALDLYLEGSKEIVIVGERQDPAVHDMLTGLRSLYLPDVTLQCAESGVDLLQSAPWLRGKSQIDGKPTAYVCQNFTCSAPVTDWEGLKKLLEK